MRRRQAVKKGKYKIKKKFIFFLCIAVYVLFCFGQQIYCIICLNKEYDNYLEKKATLLAEQKNLVAEIELLQSKSYIERSARENLGLVKPGETLLLPARESNLPEKIVNSDNIH
jgi:cell division protein FtsB